MFQVPRAQLCPNDSSEDSRVTTKRAEAVWMEFKRAIPPASSSLSWRARTQWYLTLSGTCSFSRSLQDAGIQVSSAPCCCCALFSEARPPQDQLRCDWPRKSRTLREPSRRFDISLCEFRSSISAEHPATRLPHHPSCPVRSMHQADALHARVMRPVEMRWGMRGFGWRKTYAGAPGSHWRTQCTT